MEYATPLFNRGSKAVGGSLKHQSPPPIADWLKRPMQEADHARGKPSLTRYRVLVRDDLQNFTRVELEPLAGRTHRLRVRLTAIGHPAMGDALYARMRWQIEARGEAPRLQLHASVLALAHPLAHEPMRFKNAAPFSSFVLSFAQAGMTH